MPQIDWSNWKTPPDGPWWVRWLPPKDHPLWKTTQGLAGLGLATLMVWHGIDGSHTAGFDPADGAGVLGVGILGKLVWQYLKG